ncbi:hypothetical protein B0H14DRAFT_2405594 [Mycena olivaceomarginata]|nr:hypothetical protein B0H14DRAFT_2405594 [Mycena olivaceomarginata]
MPLRPTKCRRWQIGTLPTRHSQTPLSPPVRSILTTSLCPASTTRLLWIRWRPSRHSDRMIPLKGGHIVSWDDNAMIQMTPGSTVLIPAGCKRFSFASVGPHETRYLVRQYCSAAVFRWMDKRGYADNQLATTGPEAVAKWEEVRATRGRLSLKMFSQLHEVFV